MKVRLDRFLVGRDRWIRWIQNFRLLSDLSLMLLPRFISAHRDFCIDKGNWNVGGTLEKGVTWFCTLGPPQLVPKQ